MKIRQGFVSNSSSSSFVVAFPNGFVPTLESVHNYLYGPDDTTVSAWGEGVSSRDAAKTICDDMINQEPNTEGNIVAALSGYVDGRPEYADYVTTSPHTNLALYNKQWENYDTAVEAFIKRQVKQLKSNWGDVDVYTFSFSDGAGDYIATLEHGNTFDRVKHIRVSHH